MNAYSDIRLRTTRQKVRFWECPVDTVLKTPAAAIANTVEVGELVSVDANDQLVRYNPASSGGNEPYGVLLGYPVDPLVYPAFSGDYEGKAIVGVSHNAELTVPFINNGSAANGVGEGEFIPADRQVFIPTNTAVAIIRHSTTGRWGIPVQFDATDSRWEYVAPSGTNEHFRLVRILVQTDRQEPKYAVVRQIAE